MRIVLNFLLLVAALFVSSSLAQEADCSYHGVLHDHVCVCDPGFGGDHCQHCVGRFTVTERSGWINNGPDGYSHFGKCMAIVQPDIRENETLFVQFFDVHGQCDCDFLDVYDGDSVHSPLLASFDGKVERNPYKAPIVISNSGKVLLQFHNDDRIFHSQGYDISYWTEENCGATCQGSVNVTAPPSDEIKTPDNSSVDWFWSDMQQQGRASMAAASVGPARHYVLGGVSFGDLEDTHDFLTYDSETGKWGKVFSSGSLPLRRHGHSMVVWNDSLIVFGGALDDFRISNRTYQMDLTSLEWSEVAVNCTFGDDGVPALTGHTAHVVTSSTGRAMMVFFGYHSAWRTSDLVFRLDSDWTWSLVMTSGARPSGTFGHASVLDPESGHVIVHGGYRAGNNVNSLHRFDPLHAKWTILYSSPISTYLHTLSLVDGDLYVIGGMILQEETDECEGDRLCRSVVPLKYNIDSGEWIAVENLIPTARTRYGHTQLTTNDGSVQIFGGYNGVMMSDVVRFQPTTENPCGELNSTRCNNTDSCTWEEGSCVVSTWTDFNCSSVEIDERTQCGRRGISANECYDLDCCYDDNSNNTGHNITCFLKGDERTFESASKCEDLCAEQTTCENCLSTVCDCCFDNSTNTCSQSLLCAEFQSGCSKDSYCSRFTRCDVCHAATNCTWAHNECVQSTTDGANDTECGLHVPCSDRVNCSACVEPLRHDDVTCVWCATTSTCVDSVDSRHVHDPYGICHDFIDDVSYCKVDPCNDYSDCDSCFDDDRCGWCAYDVTTGYGKCMSGGLSGPIAAGNQTCPAPAWHYELCPPCQCNGHSTCTDPPNYNCVDCDVGTTGEHCGQCDDLYFGSAKNGRNCTACECNGHASQCSDDGKCMCEVEGMIGDHCDSCANHANYYGDAVNDTCYYNLDILKKYEFVINENLNFDNCLQMENDLRLKLIAEYPVEVIVAVNSSSSGGNQTVAQTFTNVTEIDYKLSHKFFKFGFESGGSCIRIYITNDVADTNIIEITLYQQWLQIGVVIAVFVLCFLVVLLIAGVFWKVNHLYQHFRDQQAAEELMQQLATRPMTSVTLIIDDDDVTSVSVANKTLDDKVLCEEIHHNGEAAICTTILRFPGQEIGTYSNNALALGTSCVKLNTTTTTANFSRAKSNTPSLMKSLARMRPFRTARVQSDDIIIGFDNPVLELEDSLAA